MGWQGAIRWSPENSYWDPFLNIVRDVHGRRFISLDDPLRQLYRCESCHVALYGACFPCSLDEGANEVCMECSQSVDPTLLGSYAWREVEMTFEQVCAAAIETKLSALRLRDRRAKAGDLPREPPCVEPPSVETPSTVVHSSSDSDSFPFPFVVPGEEEEEEETDDPRLRRQYTYRQCPSLRDIVQVLCSIDEHDPGVRLDRELPGPGPEPKDLPFTADESKIINCTFNSRWPFRVRVLLKPDDFEDLVRVEEAEDAVRDV
ncbi:hypothetical protein VTN02DRAFT_718 [Thermoascus thermophilus]